MNKKLKSIFTNIRVIILLICLVLAIVAIYPNPYNNGVAIRNVVANSSANLAGMQSPKPTIAPMKREVITAINNKIIKDTEDYSNIIGSLKPNASLQIKTNKGLYRLILKEKTQTIELNETELRTIEETIEVNETINGTITTINKTITKRIEVPKTETTSLGLEDIGLRVYDAPKTNIRKGLDLQGGTRVLLQP